LRRAPFICKRTHSSAEEPPYLSAKEPLDKWGSSQDKSSHEITSKFREMICLEIQGSLADKWGSFPDTWGSFVKIQGSFAL